MAYPKTGHYGNIERLLLESLEKNHDGDLVRYARKAFDHDGSLKGQAGLGRVVIERLCDEVERLRNQN